MFTFMTQLVDKYTKESIAIGNEEVCCLQGLLKQEGKVENVDYIHCIAIATSH